MHPFLLRCLLVVQKRSSLLVCRHNCSFSPEADPLAKDARHSNDQCGDEQNTHDDESKDPLEGNDFDEKLLYAEGCSQDTEREANCVILKMSEIVTFDDNSTYLVCDQEEQSID